MKLKKIIKLIDNGIFIFTIPLIWYFFNYVLKLGFYSYYKLSANFIEINLKDNLSLGIIVSTVLYFIIIYSYSYKMKVDETYKTHSHKYMFYWGFALVFFLALIFIFSNYDTGKNVKLVMAAIITLFVFLCFIISSLYSYKTYKPDKKEKPIKLSLPLIAAILFVSVVFLFLFGEYSAMTKKSYVIIQDKIKRIAICGYREGFLTAEVINKTIIPKYTYIELNESITVYIEDLGQLKVGQINTD